ncbi:hypothetical protein IX39_05010 [Chryseobacterium formosense]|uniref:Uncharacterized protein n=1 Tax=Chryseobacterium formosense TaxID=236814 RepID=A0A085Z6C9_9FLAO|nr:hypothetical protein IX39_05010 [Chryseobacterium formosense]
MELLLYDIGYKTEQSSEKTHFQLEVEGFLFLRHRFIFRSLQQSQNSLFIFVRFALKQKNQKFKTWKLRLKIIYTL